MKKNTLGVLVILLSIVVLGLTGFIVYDKVLSKDAKEENTNNEVVDNGETVTSENESSFSKNASDYVELVSTEIAGYTVKKVSFKNLDSSLTEKFLNEQNELLNRLDSDKYNPHSLENGSIWYQVNGEILSVYYELIFGYEIGDVSEIVVTNIDLKSKKVLSNKEVIALANGTFEKIAEDSYNKLLPVVEECENPENNCHVIAKDGGFVILKDYTENKSKYINDIVNGLENVIYGYIKDGMVKYDYQKPALDNLFYSNAKGGPSPYLTVEIGKYS